MLCPSPPRSAEDGRAERLATTASRAGHAGPMGGAEGRRPPGGPGAPRGGGRGGAGGRHGPGPGVHAASGGAGAAGGGADVRPRPRARTGTEPLSLRPSSASIARRTPFLTDPARPSGDLPDPPATLANLRWPNPLVGSVIVKDGEVVGEGFHPKVRHRPRTGLSLLKGGPGKCWDLLVGRFGRAGGVGNVARGDRLEASASRSELRPARPG